jgi:hypothetical protein
MKKNILLGVILISVFFNSCKKEEEIQSTEEVRKTAQPFSGEAWLKQRVGNQGQIKPTQIQSQPQQNPQGAVQATSGMNPAHGQPGHRCDIAVGAPLNSAPSQKPQTTTQVVTPKPVEKPVLTVNSNKESATIVGATTPPGMNPPHGQEGHRCDIAVGAPLPLQ